MSEGGGRGSWVRGKKWRGPPHTLGGTHIPREVATGGEDLPSPAPRDGRGENKPDVLPQGKEGVLAERVKAGTQPLARWAFRLRLPWGQRGTVGRQHMGLALAGQGAAGAGSLWAQDISPAQLPAHLP